MPPLIRDGRDSGDIGKREPTESLWDISPGEALAYWINDCDQPE